MLKERKPCRTDFKNDVLAERIQAPRLTCRVTEKRGCSQQYATIRYPLGNRSEWKGMTSGQRRIILLLAVSMRRRKKNPPVRNQGYIPLLALHPSRQAKDFFLRHQAVVHNSADWDFEVQTLETEDMTLRCPILLKLSSIYRKVMLFHNPNPNPTNRSSRKIA